MTVQITLRYFEGCPSWQTALANLEVAASRTGADIEVDLETVETVEEAERLGFTGSPTLVINGVDPFAAPAAPALACRVYATPVGLAGSPTVEQLATILAAHVTPRIPDAGVESAVKENSRHGKATPDLG